MSCTMFGRAQIRLCQAGLAAIGLGVLAFGFSVGHAAEAPLTPVVVELFTSQGCSSCPPADAVLRSLSRNQPVAGVVIVPLSEHVDYWNRLGWRDPFSSPQFSSRQRAYAETLDLSTVFTPMMIVDGRAVFVGSEGETARRAITSARAHKKTRVELDARSRDASRVLDVEVSIGERAPNEDGPVDVWLAITESDLLTDVMAGENIFRRLHHTGVVRHLERLATVEPTDTTTPIGRRVRLDDAWDRSRLRAVVFLQDHATAAITGAVAVAVQ